MGHYFLDTQYLTNKLLFSERMSEVEEAGAKVIFSFIKKIQH